MVFLCPRFGNSPLGHGAPGSWHTEGTQVDVDDNKENEKDEHEVMQEVHPLLQTTAHCKREPHSQSCDSHNQAEEERKIPEHLLSRIEFARGRSFKILIQVSFDGGYNGVLPGGCKVLKPHEKDYNGSGYEHQPNPVMDESRLIHASKDEGQPVG